MFLLIYWISIMECMVKIKFVYGNERVIITVPLRIEKMHHTKTIYKIIEKPIFVDANRHSSQVFGPQSSMAKYGSESMHGHSSNFNGMNSYQEHSNLQCPVGRGHRFSRAYRNGFWPNYTWHKYNDPNVHKREHSRYKIDSNKYGVQQQIRPTFTHGFNNAAGETRHRYYVDGLKHRGHFDKVPKVNLGTTFRGNEYDEQQTFSGHRGHDILGERFANGAIMIRGQNGQNGAFTGSIVHGDRTDKNEFGKSTYGTSHGYQVQENVANFDGLMSTPTADNDYYTVSSLDNHDALQDDKSSVTVVMTPQHMIENVYYTLDPVVPYETTRRAMHANRQ